MKAILVLCAYAITVVASLGAPDQSPIPPPRDGESDTPKSLAVAKERGIHSAQSDIKRGVFRILDFGEPLPPGTGRRVDPQTRYPLESIWGCVVTERFTTEVEAYNDTMRAWHAKHKQ
jgi:hypothetical protein